MSMLWSRSLPVAVSVGSGRTPSSLSSGETRGMSPCAQHSTRPMQRRVKGADGQWSLKNIQVPPAVKEYNRYMGGVDLSDALIGYYKVLHKTMRWYKTFFYHFMDIGIVNAFLLQKDLARGRGKLPMAQKNFRETLIMELAEAGSPTTATTVPPPAPAPGTTHHKLVYISGHSTNGRLKCRLCHAKTPTKCSSCNMPLCFVASRDCFNDWHDAKNL